MTSQKVKNQILTGSFLFNRKFAVTLWFGLSLIAVLYDFFEYKSTGGISGNYKIFKYVFVHVREQVNLFTEYPLQYNDTNHYGPFFSLIIAPFALLPDAMGVVLWVMANAAILYWAIRKLPIKENWQNAILILSAHEMMTAASWVQSNPLIIACIILGFVYIHSGKEIWALFFILIAAFIKLYGVVGFAFFFFSKDKLSFIKWAIIWFAVFLIAPMVFAPLSFIFQSYQDWYISLTEKAAKNVRLDINNDYQDISVMGMIRRIFKVPNFKNIIITIPAVIIFGLQYIRYQYFSDIRYRLYLLCSVLIMTVIFTTSAESPTYIIAFPAVCLWFVLQPPAKWVNGVFVFALLLTSFSYSDIFTPYVRDHIIRPYSLKALPCFIVWLIISWQIFNKQFLLVNLSDGLGERRIKIST